MISTSGFNASLRRSLKLSEVQNRLKAVEEQPVDLLETARHVHKNIREARRLWHAKNDSLEDFERAWIDSVIGDTEVALRRLSQPIESARASAPTKHDANIGKKAARIFSSGAKIRDKHARLSACHQSLTAAISFLLSKSVTHAVPGQDVKEKDIPPPYDAQLEQLFTWRTHRKRGRSSLSSKGEVHFATDRSEVEVASSSLSSSASHQRKNSDTADLPRDSNHVVSGLVDEGNIAKTPTPCAIERPASMSSALGCTEFIGLPCVGDPADGSQGRPMSATTDTSFLPPFMNRPRATSSPACKSNEQVPKCQSAYPISPSDYFTRFPPKPTANVRRSPLSSFEISSCHELPEADKGVGNMGTEFDGVSNRTTKPGLTARHALRMNRLETGGDIISCAGAPDGIFDGADGLQLVEAAQPVYLPYRLPHLSISSSSLCPSFISMSEESNYAGSASIHGLPKLSTGLDKDQKQSAIEIGMTSPDSESPQPNERLDRLSLPVTRPRFISERMDPSYGTRRGLRKGGRDWLMFHANSSDAELCGD